MPNKEKELSQFDLAVCDNQGILFQECQWDFEKDPKDFIEKFMGSVIAEDMDGEISAFHNTGIEQIGRALLACEQILNVNSKLLNIEALYWMGYIYRYWNMWTGTKSKTIYSIANFDYMLSVYNFFHTMSPENAILKIIEENDKAT